MPCSLSRNGFDSINITKLDVFWLSNLSRYEGTEPLTFDILWPEEWAYMKLYEVCLCLLCFDRRLWCVWWLFAFDELGSFSCGQRRHQKARYHLVLSKVMDVLLKSIKKDFTAWQTSNEYIHGLCNLMQICYSNFNPARPLMTSTCVSFPEWWGMIGDGIRCYRFSQVWSSSGWPLLIATVAWRRCMEDDFNRVALGKASFFFRSWFPVDINIAATLQVCVIDICIEIHISTRLSYSTQYYYIIGYPM